MKISSGNMKPQISLSVRENENIPRKSEYFFANFALLLVFSITVFAVAVINAYHVTLLQQEVDELKRNFYGLKNSFEGIQDFRSDKLAEIKLHKRSVVGSGENAEEKQYSGIENSTSGAVNADIGSKSKKSRSIYQANRSVGHPRNSMLRRSTLFGQSDEEDAAAEFMVRGSNRRTFRQRIDGQDTLDEKHVRTGRIKPLPTVHFHGDTSKYIFGHHENYRGNGHLRHNQRKFVDWKAKEWMDPAGMTEHFELDNGVVTVKDSGLYFIYAQIYYLDEHDKNGYRVYKNNHSLLQCTITAHSTERRQKGNSCYTAGAEYLSEGDGISLRDLSDGRYSVFEEGKSFFGLIKLGDIKIT